MSGNILTITAQAPGTATITVTARDTDRATATQQMSVTVPNRPPSAVGSVPAQTVQVGSSTSVTVSQYFSDPDGDALTFSATSSSSGVARASASGSTVTITGVAAGSATITVTARDPGGLTATQQVSVTVPNRSPRAVGSVPAQTVEVGISTRVNVSQYFSDPDGDALTFSATSSSSGVARASASGSTVTITGVAQGSATITVTASDPGGLTATQRVAVTVAQANQAPRPVGSVPAQTVQVGSSTRVNVSQYFSDPDGDALTYSATSSSSSVARASASGATVTVTGVAAGSATITVTARDPGNRSATQRFSVRVESASAPDLEFTNVTPTSVTGAPGGTVRATFTLRNGGNAMAAATTVRILASTNSSIETGDTEIGNSPTSGLGAGQSRTITATVQLPSQASGTFYFGLCADAVPGESDTGNNCSQGVRVTVQGSGGPDLVVSLSRSSATVAPGGRFTYEVTIRNRGTASSASTQWRTFASSDPTISRSDTQIGQSAAVPAIGPSREVRGTSTITISSSAPAGTVYIGDCVDAVSGETNTTNNCSSAIRVTIQTTAGSDTTYTTGQTIETLPTGFWFPDQSGGGVVFRSSGGVVTLVFNNNTTAYIVENNIRYTCRTSTGCEVVNRRVTRGSVRARAASTPPPNAEQASVSWIRSVSTVRIDRGGGPEPDDQGDDIRGVVSARLITERGGSR